MNACLRSAKDQQLLEPSFLRGAAYLNDAYPAAANCDHSTICFWTMRLHYRKSKGPCSTWRRSAHGQSLCNLIFNDQFNFFAHVRLLDEARLVLACIDDSEKQALNLHVVFRPADILVERQLEHIQEAVAIGDMLQRWAQRPETFIECHPGALPID